jgi:hypothetical protein
MCEFAVTRVSSLASPLLPFLFRCASLVVPFQTLIQGDLRSALVFAFFLGIADGSARNRVARTARALEATSRGLVISSAFGTSSVRWADVLAVETWRRINGISRVAVHYRSARGGAVATCWEQFSQPELVRFVTACGARANPQSDRTTITLVGLSERGVWIPILHRFGQDLAVAACFALFSKLALLLGAIAGGLSALIACGGYALRNRNFVLEDGVWWRETKRGLIRLSVIPPSLRMWVDALNGYQPRS